MMYSISIQIFTRSGFKTKTRLKSKVFSLEKTSVDFVLERGQIFFGGGGEEDGKLKQTLPFC